MATLIKPDRRWARSTVDDIEAFRGSELRGVRREIKSLKSWQPAICQKAREIAQVAIVLM